MSTPGLIERSRRRLKMPVDLLVCLVALKVLSGGAAAPGEPGPWRTVLQVVTAVWALLWILEIWSEWRREPSPLRASLSEIHEGFRRGDPRFRPAGAAGVLSMLAAILVVVANHASR
jgi:hypothetical protein